MPIKQLPIWPRSLPSEAAMRRAWERHKSFPPETFNDAPAHRQAPTPKKLPVLLGVVASRRAAASLQPQRT